jgi:hypothetical protein
MKTMTINGVEYKEAPEKKNTSLCKGCAFSKFESTGCGSINDIATEAFGDGCAERRVIYKVVP